MTIETNKALVRRACQMISERNLPGLLELIHDQGSWSVPYRADRFQFGGFRDKPAFAAMIGQFLDGFESFSFEITAITAEGDRVAIEAASRGHGPGPARYENVYSMNFVIKDGKIHTVREFFDPFHVLAYVEQLTAAA